MTKQQFDDLYLGKAVHCDTKEKANKFLELAHGVGYSWGNFRSLLDFNYYYEYKEETCYKVNGYGFSYADVEFYKEDCITIVKFELEPIEETFNVGDVVYDESGERVEIVEYFYRVKYDDGTLSLKRESKLSKTKPLQKITREELADMGYELVD